MFPSFKTSHTTLLVFGRHTKGSRFYDKHGTTPHLFVILFPVQYMKKCFALETREIMTAQVQGLFEFDAFLFFSDL